MELENLNFFASFPEEIEDDDFKSDANKDDETENNKTDSISARTFAKLDNSRIPLFIADYNGVIIYKNNLAKRKMLKFRSHTQITRYIEELSKNDFGITIAIPEKSKIVNLIDSDGKFFRTLCVSFTVCGEIFSAVLFPPIVNKRKLESVRAYSEGILADSFKDAFSKKGGLIACGRDGSDCGEPITPNKPKGKVIDDTLDKLISRYDIGKAIPIPAYHIVDSIISVLKTNQSHLGCRFMLQSMKFSSGNMLIRDYVPFIDITVRLLVLLSAIAEKQGVSAIFCSEEDESYKLKHLRIEAKLRLKEYEKYTGVINDEVPFSELENIFTDLRLDFHTLDYVMKEYNWSVHYDVSPEGIVSLTAKIPYDEYVYSDFFESPLESEKIKTELCDFVTEYINAYYGEEKVNDN